MCKVLSTSAQCCGYLGTSAAYDVVCIVRTVRWEVSVVIIMIQKGVCSAVLDSMLSCCEDYRRNYIDFMGFLMVVLVRGREEKTKQNCKDGLCCV